jgi:formate hydrogenlyase subunit 3/multisubunit Na+/H+ antiporter MnhD subunit
LIIILVALGVLVASGLGALAAGGRHPLANRVGSLGALAGCALGLAGTAMSRMLGEAPSLRIPWSVPGGELHLEIDALASFFLLLIFGLCLMAALFGSEYLRAHADRKWLGPPWFFFNVLAASMAVVVMAADGILFLMAWEVMALSSYFLVNFEDEKESTRRAGWVYLVATHVGTVFVIVLFMLLGRESGSMDFNRWSGLPGLPPVTAGLLFLLAVVGFGTKAGIVPFHVWLPEAHPAAPAHVSAVMSGVMIKTGIYGLLRVVSFLGTPPAWWAMVLMGIGVTSGLLGVLFAVAQPDLKRVLAYSSVENVGVILLGIGLGLLGISYGEPALVLFGMTGALLHVMNHAIFKGLLFMGAGVAIHGAGTGRIDQLGGLIRKMPIAALAILAGVWAIAGLPPLNGFFGEMLIYIGALEGAGRLEGARVLLPIAALVGLALVSGLAAACFARVFGVCFLGTPRSDEPARASEAGPATLASLLALAALCVIFGLSPGLALSVVAPAAGLLASHSDLTGATALGPAAAQVAGVTHVSMILLALIAALALLRRGLLRGRETRDAVTWDCGYESPTPRMQHTGSSLARPFAEVFPFVMPGRRQTAPPEGHFPAAASLRVVIANPFQEWLYRPAFDRIQRGMSRLRWLQHGRVQLYVLYIVATLIALLAWFMAF